MPRISKTEAPITLDEPVIEGRYVELGGYTGAYEMHKADTDPAALFCRLREDRRQCPHWDSSAAARSTYAARTMTRCSRLLMRVTGGRALCR